MTHPPLASIKKRATEAEANADSLTLANEFPGSYIAKHTTYATHHTI